jgi:hypothetical protein
MESDVLPPGPYIPRSESRANNVALLPYILTTWLEENQLDMQLLAFQWTVVIQRTNKTGT